MAVSCSSLENKVRQLIPPHLRKPKKDWPKMHDLQPVKMRLAQFRLGLGAGGAYQLSPAHTAQCSWYGEERRGKLMANGVPFNPDLPIIASRDYDIDTVLELYYEGRRVRGVVLDRGPTRRLHHKGRKLDISEALFRELVGSTDADVVEVQYKLVK